ncbi:MAG: autotransporter-associated beta strand repeat-containing protein [Verrucomicrobiota bacterium]
MNKCHSHLRAAFGLILLALLPQSAQSATSTWKNTGTDWNTSGNWNGTVTPPGSADTALFNTTATNQPNLSANTTINTLSLSATTGGWTLSATGGAVLTLLSTSATAGSEAIYSNNTGQTANTISAPIVLGAANGTTQVINAPASSNLVLTGPISSTFSPTVRFSFGSRGAGNPAITLSGNNTYTGTTEINGESIGSILLLNNANALGGGGNITFLGNSTVSGVLQYSANNTVDYSARFKNSTGAIRIDTTSQNITFASSIDSSNTGGLYLLGSGNKTLSVANSYGGNTTLAAGNLFLGNNSALSSGTLSVTNNNSKIYANINNLSIANAISVATGVNAIISGTNNSTFSGPVTLAAGNSTLQLTTGANTATTLSGNITGSGGINIAHATATGATIISGNNSYSGNTTLYPGTLRIGNNNALGTGTLVNNGIGSSITTVSSDSTTARTLANNISFGALAQSNFGDATNNGALTFNGTVALNNSTTLNVLSATTFNGVVSGTNLVMAAASTSTLTLAGNNTYTGTTTINGGTLSINSIQDGGSATANALGTPAAGANSIIALSTTGTLQYTGTGNSSNRVINLVGNGGTFTLDASGASGTFALTGGVTNAGNSSTSTLKLTGTGLGSESGSIVNGTGSNTAALTKNGTGTWTLSGTNSYTGTTTINVGTLQFAKQVSLYGNNTASWTSANITVASGATAAFNVGGTGEFTSTNIQTLVALGNSTNGFKSGSNVGLNTTAGNFTYSNTIANPNGGANSLGLIKLGSNTLTLTGNNTYNGTTAVKAGTLELAATGGSQALRSTSGITVLSTGTLLLSQSDQINNSATVSLGGGTVKFGAAVSEGTTSAVGVGVLSLTSNSTIDFNNFGGTITFSNFTPGAFTLAVTNWTSGSSHLIFNADQTANLSSFTVNSNVASQNVLGAGYYEIVPEPATWALLAFSLTTVMVLRRRRNS